jgi:hypothetical protein
MKRIGSSIAYVGDGAGRLHAGESGCVAHHDGGGESEGIGDGAHVGGAFGGQQRGCLYQQGGGESIWIGSGTAVKRAPGAPGGGGVGPL